MGSLFDFVANLFGPKSFRNLKWKMFSASAVIVTIFYAAKFSLPKMHLEIMGQTIDIIPESKSESFVPLCLLLGFGLLLLVLDGLYDRYMPPTDE